MRKLNKKLIKQLANDDIAVKNTGTVEDLTEILKAAFPEGPVPTGNTMFYKKHTDFYWMGYDKPPQFPIHPTSDFFIEEEQSVDIEEELKWGEPVMCRDFEIENWSDGFIYVGRNPIVDNEYKHVVCHPNTRRTLLWKFCKRQPPKQSFTRAEYAKRLGISIDQIGDVKLID